MNKKNIQRLKRKTKSKTTTLRLAKERSRRIQSAESINQKIKVINKKNWMKFRPVS